MLDRVGSDLGTRKSTLLEAALGELYPVDVLGSAEGS